MAEYKILADSGCELPTEYRDDERFDLIPFRLEIDGVPIRDSKDLNIRALLEKLSNFKVGWKTACPSPDVFLRHFEGPQKRIYVITISHEISECYDSAMLAKKLYEQEHDDKEIIVIDSKSASSGECQIALKAAELEEEGLEFEEIKEKLIDFRDHMMTYILLNNVETLCKNNKLIRSMASMVKSLSVKQMFKGERGAIIQFGQKIDLKNAYEQMVDSLAAKIKEAAGSGRKIIITHCNNLAGAEELKKMLMEKTGIKDFIIMSTSGFSSMYAKDGGLVVTF